MFQTNYCFSLTVTFCMIFYHFNINIDLIGRSNLFLTLKKREITYTVKYNIFFIERASRDKNDGRIFNINKSKKNQEMEY